MLDMYAQPVMTNVHSFESLVRRRTQLEEQIWIADSISERFAADLELERVEAALEDYYLKSNEYNT